MEKEERRFCPFYALNITVSEEDRDRLSRLAPEASFAVVPNGVDVEFFRPRREQESGIVFVGGMSWFPNKDALEYFGRQILPLIRMRVGQVGVSWVGRCSEEERSEARERFGINLTGHVEDVRPHIGRAGCYVVPLRVGGGTRIKILDAWAMGKAIVSTAVGCEGLDARDGENILIRDEVESFANAVVRILKDERLRQKLGARGRETVEKAYSWEAIGQDMNCRYANLVSSGQKATRLMT